MIKRIIFDIDGTLITGINFYPVVLRTLQRYGINDVSKAQTFINNIKQYENTYGYYAKNEYLSFFSEKLGVHLDDAFLNYFFDELKTAVPPDNRRLYEILASLKGYELVLLSNYFEESQRNRLRTMGINDFFTEYHGEKRVKPHIEAYLSAAGPYKPSECLIIGDDKELDINIPSRLGFNTLYVHADGDIKHINDLSLEMIKRIEKQCDRNEEPDR